MTKKVIPISRRELLKAGVAATTAMTVGLPVTQAMAQAAKDADAGIVWRKGVCRFCGQCRAPSGRPSPPPDSKPSPTAAIS